MRQGPPRHSADRSELLILALVPGKHFQIVSIRHVINDVTLMEDRTFTREGPSSLVRQSVTRAERQGWVTFVWIPWCPNFYWPVQCD
jgi:hypothetical protein